MAYFHLCSVALIRFFVAADVVGGGVGVVVPFTVM